MHEVCINDNCLYTHMICIYNNYIMSCICTRMIYINDKYVYEYIHLTDINDNHLHVYMRLICIIGQCLHQCKSRSNILPDSSLGF